jgi:hypothetical protein
MGFHLQHMKIHYYNIIIVTNNYLVTVVMHRQWRRENRWDDLLHQRGARRVDVTTIWGRHRHRLIIIVSLVTFVAAAVLSSFCHR